MTDAPWTAPDGTLLGWREWRPADPRAHAIAMHGLGCRAADFGPLAQALCEKGIAFAAWNLRGQGLDPVTERRGAWLDLDGMLADLRAFADETNDLDAPLFLCGESMGALLALQAAVDPTLRNRISGLLLFSPVTALAQKNPAWLKALLRAFARAFPRQRLKAGWFIHGSGAMPRLTRIEERQHYLATAPHRLGPLTLNFLAAMGDLIDASFDAASRLDIPVAMFTGGQDVFTTPAQFEEFFSAIRADKTHFHYERSYHQLLFDLDAPQVVADAAGWLLNRISPQSAAHTCR